MEKNFEKYGVAHYMAASILNVAAGISVLEQFLKDNHPEILNEGISKRFPEYEVMDLLDSITKSLEKIGEITRETDTFLFYKKDQEHEN